MGLFLETVIVKCDDMSLLKQKITELSKEYPEFELDESGCRYLERHGKGIQLLLNEGCIAYDKFSARLSEKLNTWLMFLYIYDDDFWGYYLYDKGMEMDRFSPDPEYFGEDENAEMYSGDAGIVSKYFGIPAESIENYLVEWTDEHYEEGDLLAYDQDEYAYADPWQMADFMDKLGYPYEW